MTDAEKAEALAARGDVGKCPYCGRLAFVDEIEPPADYCHHETAPPA